MNFFPISYSKPALVDAPYCLAVWAFFVNEICTCMRIFIKILVFCFENCSNLLWEKKLLKTLLTAERIWFRCDLYLRFITPMNLWKICIDLRPFSKYFNEPFSRTLRSPRSNNLEIQNNENSKWKLVKSRWNPKFCLSDLRVLKNGSLKYFENGLKSMQIFQRLMRGMNCR